jgi:hypothetical protein
MKRIPEYAPNKYARSPVAGLTATLTQGNRCWLMAAHSFSSPLGRPSPERAVSELKLFPAEKLQVAAGVAGHAGPQASSRFQCLGVATVAREPGWQDRAGTSRVVPSANAQTTPAGKYPGFRCSLTEKFTVQFSDRK